MVSAENRLADQLIIEQEELGTKKYLALQTVMQKTFLLVAGPAYVYAIARVFAWATQTSLTKSVIIAFCASTALIVIISCLSVHMWRERVATRRFSLSTLLLVMSGLTIFFAPIGVMYRAIASEVNDAPSGVPFLFFLYAIVFVPFSIMILVYFIDSVLWFACKVQHVALSHRPPTSDGGKAESPQR